MRASGRGLIVALVCLLNFFGSSVAAAQPSDQVIAERVLGPQWKQFSRRAGMIFAGTVLASTRPAMTIDRAIPAVQVSFRVDRAIAGVERGQVLTIREWAGAWSSSLLRPMNQGQHILIFLYPPSRLGLTSPVGGSLGQVALDASGKNVSRTGFTNALQSGRPIPQGLKPAFFQGLNGTTEAVPYSKPIYETRSKYEQGPAAAIGPRNGSSRQPRGPQPNGPNDIGPINTATDTGTVSVVQLERAIRSARREQE